MAATLGDWTLDLDGGLATRGAQRVELTDREVRLLRCLIAANGDTVSRDQLHQEVFGYVPGLISRAADVAITRLRAKLEDDRRHPRWILTVRGEGYCLATARESAPLVVQRRFARIGGVLVELSSGLVRSGEDWEALTGAERVALELLVSRRGDAVSVSELARRAGVGASGVRKLVLRLRRVLGAGALVTVRGVGYRLEGVDVRDWYWHGETVPMRPSLIGRASELEETRACLLADRQVSLLGPGGAGKTALAAEVAWSVESWGLSGQRVVWVDLLDAPADGLEPALMHAITGSVQADSGRLAVALRVLQPLLVVIDHASGPEVQGLVGKVLQSASEIQVLVCTREALGMPWERVLPVQGLGERDASALFAERTRALGGRVPDDVSTDALVRRVDGLPLGVLLLAARARRMGVAALAARLTEPLDELVDATRPRRHRTLRAVAQEAWEGLDPALQRDVMALAVLQGSFEEAGAQAVLGCATLWDALDRLEALEARSWLQSVDDPSGLRVHMPSMLSRFAREHADEEALRAAEQAYVQWCADWMRQASERLRGPGGAAHLQHMVRERHHARAALDLAVAAEHWDAVGELVSGLAWIQQLTGQPDPVWRSWIDDARVPARWRLDLLLVLLNSEQRTASRAVQEERLALASRLDVDGREGPMLEALWARFLGFWSDPRAEEAFEAPPAGASERVRAVFFSDRGLWHRWRGRFDSAVEDLEHALSLVTRIGGEVDRTVLLGSLAIVHAERGDLERGAALLVEASNASDAVGRTGGALNHRVNLAHVLIQSGAFEEAIPTLRDAERQALASGRSQLAVHARGNLGIAQGRRGDLTAARASLETAIAEGTELGFTELVGALLVALAEVHLDAGETEAARSVISRAEAMDLIAAEAERLRELCGRLG